MCSGAASPVRATSSTAPRGSSESYSPRAPRFVPPTTPSCGRWFTARSRRWKAGSNNLAGRRLRSYRTPDRLRGIGHELELCPLVGFRHRIAGNGRRKAALRADRELCERDILRGFLHAALEHLARFERGSLAADEAQDHALVLDEAQRLEVAGALGVVFEQEMGHPGAAEEALGNRFVAARAQIVPPEIAAAHVHADDDARRHGRDRIIDGLDIEINKRVGLLADRLDLLPDGRVAQQRDRNL